jgi:hypothetical protein
MTYEKFIDNILNTRGRFACGEKYHERHHIQPICCNGNNDEKNLIDLFAEEHYEAHKLLALENPNNDKLQFAWWQMCHCKKEDREYEVSAEDYAMAKEAHAVAIQKQSIERWANPKIRAKIQASLSDPKTRKKMSESAKKRYNTVEGKAHIAEMWTNELKASVSKSVFQFTKDGEFVCEYFGAREAARCTNIVPSSIIECCNGKRKSAGGFIWKYKD